MSDKVQRSCKVGTIPALVYLWGNSEPEVSKAIKFRHASNGTKWQRGIVDRINPDGYFFISLM